MDAGSLERRSSQLVGGRMSSHLYPCRLLLVAVLVVTLGGGSDWTPLLWAAPPNSKQGAKSPTIQSLGLDRKAAPVTPKASAKPPTKSEPSRALAAGPQGPSVDRAHRKTARIERQGKSGAHRRSFSRSRISPIMACSSNRNVMTPAEIARQGERQIPRPVSSSMSTFKNWTKIMTV